MCGKVGESVSTSLDAVRRGIKGLRSAKARNSVSIGSRAVLLSMLFIGSTHAANNTLMVTKTIEINFRIGGLLALFRKNDPPIKSESFSLEPMHSTVTIQFVALNQGSCAFDSVSLPATLLVGQKLNLKPKCYVTDIEAVTDKGTYTFDVGKIFN